MGISREEFEAWGFRWPETATERLLDGRQVTIEPTGYLASRESFSPDESWKKSLRQYNLRFSDGATAAEVSELHIERLLGERPEGASLGIILLGGPLDRECRDNLPSNTIVYRAYSKSPMARYRRTDAMIRDRHVFVHAPHKSGEAEPIEGVHDA